MTEQQIDQTDVTVDQTDVDATATDATDQSTEPDGDTDTATDDGKEAARYRRRLRDTEKQRDVLLGQVEALQRAAIDKEVQRHRVTPEGFWASGITVEQLVDDTGIIDAVKVADAVKDAVSRLGLTQKRGLHIPSEGANPRVHDTGNSWTDAFMPR